MKKIAILSFGVFSLIGCANNAPQSVAVQNSNSNIAVVNRSQPQTVAAHSTEKSLPPTSANPANGMSKPGSASTESPMARPIDVSAQTAKIEAAEKQYKAKPNDSEAKENLAAARFERAFMLTEAAQYRAALGDFRKGLKLNPNDADAKKMHDEILRIFASPSVNREPPKEGEEPQPMPFNK